MSYKSNHLKTFTEVTSKDWVSTMSSLQSTSRFFMVEPAGFCSNPDTLETNKHQEDSFEFSDLIQQKALKEHQAFQKLLTDHGIEVVVKKGTPATPDALFCNNWVSTHQDGTFCLYPMLAPNRRLERQAEFIDELKKSYRLDLDYSDFEKEGKFLESTGSLVLDRVNKIAYAARSARTDEDLVKIWCEKRGYTPVIFDCLDQNGYPEYHTNVVMFLGTKVAGLCTEGIPEIQRKDVIEQLSKTHQIIELSYAQIQNFCGNMLEAQNKNGEYFLILSQAAYENLTSSQLDVLESFYDKLLYADLSTIEKYGGGSARCLLLELF